MVNPHKVGLVIGGWHFVWSVLVLLGWAQPILDFIFWAHMIQQVYFVKPFDPVAAVRHAGSGIRFQIKRGSSAGCLR